MNADSVRQAIETGDRMAGVKDHVAAVNWYTAALEKVQADGEMAGTIHQRLGGLYAGLGDYLKSLDHYLRALQIFQDAESYNAVPDVLHSLGIVYLRVGDHAAARNCLMQCVQAAEETGDLLLEVQAVRNLADVHLIENNSEQALDCAMRALAAYNLLGDHQNVATTMIAVAHIHERQGELDNALAFVLQAAEYLDARSQPPLLVEALLDVGRINRKLERLDAAAAALESGLSLQPGIDDRRLMYQLHQELATVLEKTGNYRRSLEHYKLYVDILQEFSILEKQTAVAELQMRFDLERTLKEEKLRQQNSVVQAVIETQEAERRRIGGDLHDGVGQLLASMRVNLLQLAPRGLDASPEHSTAYQRSLSLLDAAVRDVRAISHALASSTLAELGIEAALRELAEMATTPSCTISVDIIGLDHPPPEYVALGLYRIAQELLSNILRHAEATEVLMQVNRHPGSMVMLVEDNGVGFSSDGRDRTGMGIKNIETRVRTLDGTLKIDSVSGRGTTAVVEVPLDVRHP